MTPPVRCAIYTRKSTEDGLDQAFNSLEAQRQACEAYVLSQAGEGWTALATPYDDGGFSGGSMQRPALKQLLADIDRGRVDVVVVYKVDRLTRTLLDFSRIIAAFEARSVAFVSVTQAFNTTSSMGRLTLNVLLSFAQFEREITSERIRDKIAASKAKGLRMGGHPPLGYDIRSGRLVVNRDEAARVQDAFQQYDNGTSLNQLALQGFLSKRWRNRSGSMAGGLPMSPGAIRYLLMNPVYLGVTRHKDRLYPGTHPAIVEEALWKRVQARLTRPAHPKPDVVAAPLAGLLFDDCGAPMSPSVMSRRGRRYRYYLSRARKDGTRTASLPRISARAIEPFVEDRVLPLLALVWMPDLSAGDRVARAILSVAISRDQILIRLVNEALSANGLVGADVVSLDEETRTLRFPFHVQRRRGAILIHSKDGGPPPSHPDRALIRAVVLARDWAKELETGAATSVKALARSRGLCPGYTRRLLPLAWLAPDLVHQILDGRQPPAMTLSSLVAEPLPLNWEEQRRLFDRIGARSREYA